jgi:hypothetical protein
LSFKLKEILELVEEVEVKEEASKRKLEKAADDKGSDFPSKSSMIELKISKRTCIRAKAMVLS